MEYLGINIDLSRDSLFSESGLQRLKDGYMLDDETSPQHRFAYVSKAFSSNPEHAQRLYDYSSKMWLSYATPILSYGKTKKSLPISCFGSLLDDSMESILGTSSETRMLAVVGGGVGLHVGLRPGDKKSSGIIPHLKTYDADTLAFKQGTTRRGATAAYLDVNHPEIIEFLEMRKPTGGDPNRKCLNLHHGINISDDFMRRVELLSTQEGLSTQEREELEKFPLVNPHTKEVVEYISTTELWERILTVRMETGEPYLLFIDTANAAVKQYQKDLGLSIKGSNLCIEIMEVTDMLRSFVCCLSSYNLETYDDWKGNKQFIRDVHEMLDNVLTVFIEKASQYPELKKVVYSAIQERSIGMGAMGWHALLQKRGIPFESALAVGLNNQIWSWLNETATEVNIQLANERGTCPDAASGGVVWRNTNMFAIAPNASSAIILNTSPSIEPYKANIFLEKGVNGTKTTKNKFLVKLLQDLGKDTQEVWSEIISNDGSVATLDFLDDYQKDVFKTAIELDQTWLVQHAADRQQYVCQGQSLNLFFSPTVDVQYLHLVHLMAWQQGLKSLYYCRSSSMRKADSIGKKVERERIETLAEMASKLAAGEDECLACAG
jgi:ribonucleoside-diphosphate reductase alpha chain